MKTTLIWSILLGAVVSLFIVLVCSCARAGATDPPSKMDALKAAQLDAALAHLRELAVQEQPLMQTVQGICTEYKINPQELGRSVQVNFATGDIVRPASKPGLKP